VLAFIEHKLAPKHQVIYTTHSPFLIDPRRIDRVRTVTDAEDRGTIITADGYKTDIETMFPLQAAVSYELARAFVTGPDCLLVGWPSDLVYLQLLNQACQDANLTTLDPRWIVTPVGGADKVSAFASLVGSAKLNVAVLIDGSPRDQQRIKSLPDNGYLLPKSVIQVSDFAPGREADLEDLLDPATYCAILSGAYSSALPRGEIKPADLRARLPRITAKAEAFFKDNDIAQGRLDRYKVAYYFLREQADLLPKLSASTLDRTAKMFERVNSCLTAPN
jgi:hypothetical protein